MKEFFIVTFLVSAPLMAQAGPEQDALNSVALASFKQSGLEDALQAEVNRRLSKVPDDFKFVTGNVFFIAKVVRERSISYSWTFP